jgi:hypothetical protein
VNVDPPAVAQVLCTVIAPMNPDQLQLVADRLRELDGTLDDLMLFNAVCTMVERHRRRLLEAAA